MLEADQNIQVESQTSLKAKLQSLYNLEDFSIHTNEDKEARAQTVKDSYIRILGIANRIENDGEQEIDYNRNVLITVEGQSATSA
jgi:hypothetical protein